VRARTKMLHRRDFLVLSGAALIAGLAPAYARGATPLTKLRGVAFGTNWSVSLPSGTDLSRLRGQLAALLDDVDMAFSPWRADSIVALFNVGASDDRAVTDEVVDVTRSALGIAEASGGRFDPTVGPLVARWGFGPIRKGEIVSNGWREIDAGDRHLFRKQPGLTLDLCGIAKGHALDRMVALLLDTGLDHFLVDLGGELAARGRNPSGRIWQVGVEDPRPSSTDFVGILLLDGMAVATSGDRINGYDLGDRRYSHIIDPARREPVESALASVSVLLSTGREADGWATALMAAGPEGPELARRQNIPALFLFRDGNGLRRVATGTFENHLA